MPSSRSISFRLPRDRRKLSSRAIWSRSRRPKRPTPNSPSSAVPQLRQCRRVMVSSPAQTGQVAMTSWAISAPPGDGAVGPALGAELVDALGPVAVQRSSNPALLVDADLRIEDAVVEHCDWLLPECETGIAFVQPMVLPSAPDTDLSTPFAKI